MTARRRVSIVIPTLNAGPLLGRLLDAVDGQEGDYDRELIAIDSGSTDGTLDRLRDRGVIIRHVPPGGFNHGEARNAALDVASADVAILLVQDAVPAASGWLQALVRPLDADDRVAGSFARQQPWPDASRLTAYYLDQWVAARAEPRTVGPLSRSRLDAMLPADRHLSCAFDNVCSCIRMSAWRKYRFRRTPIAEDLLWAREVLTAGYRLAYVPEAVVWHSHERPVAYEFRRTYRVHQQLQLLFGLATVPTPAACVRSMAAALALHCRLAATEPRGRARALWRGAGLAVALPLGQYLGARSSREGRELVRVDGV